MRNGPYTAFTTQRNNFINNILNTKNTDFTPEKINTLQTVPESFKLDPPKESLTTQDELIPLIDVETSIKEQQNLGETFSSTTSKMNREKLGSYSSDDSIQSSKSVASSSGKDSGQQTPQNDLRRKSLTKSNTSLSKTPPKRGSLENTPRKMERAISTEQLSKKFESKVTLNAKKPRSQVVAAVTSRLYNKTKRKDASTDTDDINAFGTGVLDLLTENAKSRLREITRRALKAHRIKHQDTQTDFVPARRMKERATDSRDLKLELLEVKHSETMTVLDTQDASVDCTGFVNIFGEEDADKNFCFTRSCGTQFNKDESDRKLLSKPQAVMSFTKYLREVKEECNNDAIYTNVVNINISNHYSKEKISNSSSSDSLDQIHAQSLVTPDLLSNHPPLETCSKEVQTWFQGNIMEVDEKFLGRTIDLPNDDVIKDYSKAKCSTIPNHFIAIPSIKMLKTHVPETCLASAFDEEFCIPLQTFESNSMLPKVVECHRVERDDLVLVTEPPVLQPVAKNQYGEETFQSSFRKKIQKNGDATQRMVSAMSVFLEEAAGIMSKFSEKIETKSNFDLELTVNGIDLKTPKKKKKMRRLKRWDLGWDEKESIYSEKGSQTLLPIKYSCSTQSEEPIALPVNKYEAPLKECCASLENKIRRVSWAPPTKFSDDEEDEDTDDLLSESAHVEASSLESTPPAYSDYGSLPKRKKVKYKTLPSASPKTYLEQLRSFRKNIVEKSRDSYT